ASLGNVVPHLHWHVIPRWSGDTNFFPLIAETKALPQTLEQTHALLAPRFQELMK
ncbi:MAG TPA: HIT domain-containing protein, partial [Bdellovibrionales bacterium]|nr:HIT domain-containing protein [Bdellovibrionales bacterium]